MISRYTTVELVEAILKAYPDSVKQKNEFGVLPLFAALDVGARTEVVVALLKAYPDSAREPDNCQ